MQKLTKKYTVLSILKITHTLIVSSIEILVFLCFIKTKRKYYFLN